MCWAWVLVYWGGYKDGIAVNPSSANLKLRGWPIPLAWVLGESASNPCLWGGAQAKAILVLYPPWGPVSCCISSKHGFHPPAPVGPRRILAKSWKPCLELVLHSGRVVGIRCAELESGFPKTSGELNWLEPKLMKLGRWPGLSISLGSG